ncbi:MAG: hypothetical protein NC401_19650 [Ruminococcus sp.]|nr:hypothetical protein [Ruminococcus sp.]
MFKLLRANHIRMFRSLEFMACSLVSLALGAFNLLSTCFINAPSYQTSFDKDFFTMSPAAVFISAVFAGLFFGTENSMLRNKLIVGCTRGEVYWANCVTALSGTFIINAANLLPYALIAPFRGSSLGKLTPEEFMLNVLTEVLAVTAAGSVCFLVTAVLTRKSHCAAGTLLAALVLLYLPETGGAMRYSPFGQLGALLGGEYTSPFMASCSLAVITASALSGFSVFRFKNIK